MVWSLAITNPFTKPLEQLLLWLNDLALELPLPQSISSWAVAFILMAVVIKLLTHPLTVSQLRMSRAMQAMQPKLKEIQTRYKDDREKLAQAQMELYRQEGVGPWSGCLPVIIQMVIVFGLYAAIGNLNARHLFEGQRFLWIPNLAQCEPSPLCTTGGTSGVPILLIVMILSQFAYQRFATPPPADPQAKAMNQSMMLMPLVFGFFFARLQAGLVLYWTVFNILSVATQSLLMRDGAAVAGSPPAPAAQAATGPAGGYEESRTNEQAEPRRRRRKKNR